MIHLDRDHTWVWQSNEQIQLPSYEVDDGLELGHTTSWALGLYACWCGEQSWGRWQGGPVQFDVELGVRSV